MDKHSENYDTIFYEGRGQKDKVKYFVENTDKNPENLKMKNNKTPFPIYVKNKDGYFYLGRYVIGSVRKKKQFNPNSGRDYAIMRLWDLFAKKYNIIYFVKFKKI